jgi:hypothetical protein
MFLAERVRREMGTEHMSPSNERCALSALKVAACDFTSAETLGLIFAVSRGHRARVERCEGVKVEKLEVVRSLVI